MCLTATRRPRAALRKVFKKWQISFFYPTPLHRSLFFLSLRLQLPRLLIPPSNNHKSLTLLDSYPPVAPRNHSKPQQTHYIQLKIFIHLCCSRGFVYREQIWLSPCFHLPVTLCCCSLLPAAIFQRSSGLLLQLGFPPRKTESQRDAVHIK